MVCGIWQNCKWLSLWIVNVQFEINILKWQVLVPLQDFKHANIYKLTKSGSKERLDIDRNENNNVWNREPKPMDMGPSNFRWRDPAKTTKNRIYGHPDMSNFLHSNIWYDPAWRAASRYHAIGEFPGLAPFVPDV